jgi:hypothetical protein
MPEPLNRKFDDHFNACPVGQQVAMSLAHVEPDCVKAWARMKALGRTDSFIGLTDTTSWIFYLAPCAGVDASEATLTALSKTLSETAFLEAVARGDFSDTPVLFGNTAAAAGRFSKQTLWKSALDTQYGAGAVCYVPLEHTQYAGSNFDGQSHKSCFRWAKQRFGLPGAAWNQVLGWAIQKDNGGYYLRFASALNERWGQGGSRTFTERQQRPDKIDLAKAGDWHPHASAQQAKKEPRDLPKTWAQFFERVLARDLGLTLQDAAARHERMTARDENKTTKLRRFQPGA